MVPDNLARERIVGFDAREFWVDFDSSWSDSRKRTFLYRLDIRKPLSIDTRVWPKIFEAENVPEPQRIGFASTWADLADCRAAVTASYQRTSLRAFRLVAIILQFGQYCAGDDVPWDARLTAASPAHRADGWVFLGFDVADQYLLSGLSNCGFRQGYDDVDKLRLQWGPRLNQWHLFDQFEDAVAFKQYSDERLKMDHAPFFVFGVWIVK